MRRRGFTLVELLTVISILVILAGLVLWGALTMVGRMHVTSTRATMESLKSMMGEYEAKTRFTSRPRVWFWGGVDQPTAVADMTDFWKVPQYTNNLTGFGPLALPAPILTTPQSTDDAIRNTAVAIFEMRKIPSIKTAFDKLPTKIIQTHTDNGVNYPVVVDAWGNVIIFVPATGLNIIGNTGVLRVLRTSGIFTNNGNAAANLASNDRPFFASSGPDGDFAPIANNPQATDDNLYSFEQ